MSPHPVYVGDPDRTIHWLEAVLNWYETHDLAVDADGGEESEAEEKN